MLPLKVKQNSGGFYFAEAHQRETEAEALSAEKHTQCENMQGHVFLGGMPSENGRELQAEHDLHVKCEKFRGISDG